MDETNQAMHIVRRSSIVAGTIKSFVAENNLMGGSSKVLCDIGPGSLDEGAAALLCKRRPVVDAVIKDDLGLLSRVASSIELRRSFWVSRINSFLIVIALNNKLGSDANKRGKLSLENGTGISQLKEHGSLLFDPIQNVIGMVRVIPNANGRTALGLDEDTL